MDRFLTIASYILILCKKTISPYPICIHENVPENILLAIAIVYTSPHYFVLAYIHTQVLYIVTLHTPHTFVTGEHTNVDTPQS